MTFSVGQAGSNLAQCPDVEDVSHWLQLADAETDSLEVLRRSPVVCCEREPRKDVAESFNLMTANQKESGRHIGR